MAAEEGDEPSALVESGDGETDDTAFPITVIVHEARCLPEVHYFGSQKPYVCAFPLPSRRMEAKTPAAQDDGSGAHDCVNPSWASQELVHSLTVTPARTDDKLRLEVPDERLIVDASIGFVDLSIGAHRGGSKRCLMQLEPGGLLDVSIIDGNAPPPEDSGSRSREARAQRQPATCQVWIACRALGPWENIGKHRKI